MIFGSNYKGNKGIVKMTITMLIVGVFLEEPNLAVLITITLLTMTGK